LQGKNKKSKFKLAGRRRIFGRKKKSEEQSPPLIKKLFPACIETFAVILPVNPFKSIKIKP